jgi:PIN domain nuclease of toxin-antitoxin system
VKLLLDTHVWLWSAIEPKRLSDPTRAALLDASNEIYLSAASIWETAIKVELGKLQLPTGLAEFVANQTGPGVAEILPINADHAIAVAELPRHHRDPFDRLLVAQAKVEELTLVTVDEAVRAYGVPVLWAE